MGIIIALFIVFNLAAFIALPGLKTADADLTEDIQVIGLLGAGVVDLSLVILFIYAAI